MAENKELEVVKLRVIIKKLFGKRKVFYKVLPLAFVLACIYILGVPRYYKSEAKLAPEVGNAGAGGALSSIASSFGFDIGDMQTSDAITPLLYPDLMEDNGFIVSMYGIRVKSLNGEIDMTYHDYVEKKTKLSVWAMPKVWIKELFKSKKQDGPTEINPYQLSKHENDIAEAIRSNVKLSVDKKNGVITINVKAQDPLVSKIMADSITDRLQVFITDYRTNKARIDYEYYKGLTQKAKEEYDEARKRYANVADANMNVVMQSMKTQIEDLENDMQLKFNTYSTMNTQMQAAKAKVQERTPAFSVIKGAAVPVKPAGPKRVFFVLTILILTFIATSLYLVREDLHLKF